MGMRNDICLEEQGVIRENGLGLKRIKGEWVRTGKPLCDMTVYVHNGDMRPFHLTRENVRDLLAEVIQANPHLKFSYENIDTFEKYRKSIDYYMRNSALEGMSYQNVAGEMIGKLENDCMFAFDLPYNPFWEMSEEDVLEIENLLRRENNLEPVEKMLR